MSEDMKREEKDIIYRDRQRFPLKHKNTEEEIVSDRW